MSRFTNEDRIYRQIEAKADLHSPALYGLLSFYHALDLQPDSLDGRLIPLTTAQRNRADQTKIFAIGLIPPAIPVSDRKLDRSATLQAKLGAYTEVVEVTEATAAAAKIADAVQVEEVQSNAVNDPLFVSVGPNSSMVTPTKGVAARSDAMIQGLHPSIQVLAVKLIGLAAQQGISLVICEGVRTQEYQDGLYAKGRTAPVIGKVVTGTRDSWHIQGLAFDVAMVSAGPKPKLGQPSWPPGMDLWNKIGSLGESIGLKWGGHFPKIGDYGHFEYHPGITKEQAKAGARPPVPEGAKPIADTALPATNWKKVGSPAANTAAKTTSQISDKDLNTTSLGKSLLAAQESNIKLMQAAVEQIANTPPLRMLVNPQSLRVSSEKLISSGNRGRHGPIIEHWGDQPDKIEGSGKIAAFYSMEANGVGPGLTRNARQFSTSYQNFLSLFLIYKNNGGVWFPDPLVPDRKNNLSVVGSVYLYYDNILYIGSFDSLSVNETDDAPFTLDYSFSFTVRAWFLLDHLDDPQYTYRDEAVTPALPTTSGSGLSPLQGGNNAQPSPTVQLPPLEYYLKKPQPKMTEAEAFALLDSVTEGSN